MSRLALGHWHAHVLRYPVVITWWSAHCRCDPLLPRAADGRPEVKDVRKLCEAITDDAVDPVRPHTKHNDIVMSCALSQN